MIKASRHEEGMARVLGYGLHSQLSWRAVLALTCPRGIQTGPRSMAPPPPGMGMDWTGPRRS